MLDLQKASLLKRLSAFILDMILLGIFAVGFGSVISAVVGYDGYMESMEACYLRYEAEYGIDFDISPEEYEKLSEEQQAVYSQVNELMAGDEEAQYLYNMVISLFLTIVSLGILLAYLALEFAVPLLIGNGQTIGKRVFSLGVMRNDGVKINAVTLFVRTVLGKYTIGTMVPVLVIMMIILGTIGILGPAIVMGIVAIQAGCMIATSTNSAIHDLLANTVVVDISSQMIFGSESELLAYKQRLHAEHVARHDR